MHRLALLTLVLVTGSGCIQRTITVTSDPEGALVFLNDEEVGRTPLTVPFTFYGVYDVRLEKSGYKPLWTTAATKGPFWEAPGPDLIAEAIPGVKSKVEWHFEMEQIREDELYDTKALIERAEELRNRTRY